MTAVGWYYLDTNSVQWCINLNTSQWSKFGQADTPAVMVLIPAGTYVMGGTTNMGHDIGYLNENPQHTVYVSAFYMDKYEVTKALWDEVKAYNGGNGYNYAGSQNGKAANHPVYFVSWYDCVKWCNARSQKEGRTPVYYTDAGLTQVYKTGQIAPHVHWTANGYRLPTEAEWEKAARGGVANRRFPWPDVDTIDHSRANYYANSSGYDLGYAGYDTNYMAGGIPYTSPAGSFEAGKNGYGLYDMVGNVHEWCWDWFDANWYGTAGAIMADTRGPDTGSVRVLRGGSWDSNAASARAAVRSNDNPDGEGYVLGFRCARRL